MKTFKSELEKLDKNEMVYVGMKDGSGWVVIETAGTLLKKMNKLNECVRSISEDIIKFNTKLALQATKLIPVRKEELKKLENTPAETFKEGLEKRALKEKKPFKEKKTDAEELKKKALEHIKYSIERNKAEKVRTLFNIETTFEYLGNYVLMKNRKVIDMYKHNTDIEGICMVLEGNEKGELWYYGEKESILK